MFQEDSNKLSKKALDLKRAIDSLNEEMGAVDAYNQRAERCSDETLRKILMHNMNEEKEHAAMLLEWIRRNDKNFEKEIAEIIGSAEKDIVPQGH